MHSASSAWISPESSRHAYLDIVAEFVDWRIGVGEAVGLPQPRSALESTASSVTFIKYSKFYLRSEIVVMLEYPQSEQVFQLLLGGRIAGLEDAVDVVDDTRDILAAVGRQALLHRSKVLPLQT